MGRVLPVCGCLMALALLLAGCVLPPDVRVVGGMFLGDVHFATTLEVGTLNETGFRAWRVSGAENVSFFAEYAATLRQGTPHGLHVALVLDDGTLLAVPGVYGMDEAPTSPAGPAPYVGVGDRVVAPERLVPPAAVRKEFAHFAFTNATAATLLVLWSHEGEPPEVRVHWLEGARVEPLAATDAGVFASLADFQGGVRAGGGFGAVATDAALPLPEPASLTFVRVFGSLATAGELAVEDDAGRRVVPIGTISKAVTVVVTSGPARIHHAGAGTWGVRVEVASAPVPEGLLPTLWETRPF